MKDEEIIFINETQYEIHTKADSNNLESSEQKVECLFTFTHDNSKYANNISSLLQYLLFSFARDSKIDSILINIESSIVSIYAKATASIMLELSNMLSSRLPLSLHFTFKDMSVLDSKIDLVGFRNIESISQNIPSASDMLDIVDENKSSYYDISNFIKIKECNIESNIADTKALIDSMADMIINRGYINMQHNETRFKLSLESSGHIIFTDLYNIASYLRASNNQSSMLAAYEKPFVSLICKEVFKKELNANSEYKVFARLPSDCLLVLLFDSLQKRHAKDYLFYTELSEKEHIDIAYCDSMESNILHATASSKHNIYMQHKYSGSSLFDILDSNKSEKKRLVVHISKRNKNALWLQHGESISEMVEIDFAKDLHTHLHSLYHYTNGDKLISNFINTYGDIASTWGIINVANVPSKDIESSDNLTHLFTLAKELLALPNSVISYANRCVRDRGPRIDYKLIRVEDSIRLDYPRFLRSIMSFKLAGVEEELISYGIIESMSEFIGTLASDMLMNYGIEEIFVSGDMLLEQVFLDSIIYAMPKNIPLNLPRDFVDY